mgnify:CR=1 FL=1
MFAADNGGCAEFLAEGSLSKNSAASFLAMYRYSTVKIFSLMGINLGTSAVPKYQDFSDKINKPIIPTKNHIICLIKKYESDLLNL